jgi:hypothetical protein
MHVRTNSTIYRASTVAIPTKNLKSLRKIVFNNPPIESKTTGDVQTSSMDSAIAIFVVKGQECQKDFSATGAFSAVMFNDGFFSLFTVGWLINSLIFLNFRNVSQCILPALGTNPSAISNVVPLMVRKTRIGDRFDHVLR